MYFTTFITIVYTYYWRRTTGTGYVDKKRSVLWIQIRLDRQALDADPDWLRRYRYPFQPNVKIHYTYRISIKIKYTVQNTYRTDHYEAYEADEKEKQRELLLL